MKKNFDTSSKEYQILSERSDRIAKIRGFYFKGQFEEFARKLQVSSKYASGLCNKKEVITDKTLEKILSAFPSVSREWLYFGKGEMFVNGSQVNNQSNMTVKGDNIVNGSTKTTTEGMETLITTNARLATTLQQQADQIDRLLKIIESKL